MQANARQVIVGLGKTGVSCVRHLVALGFDVAVTDNRTAPPGWEEIAREFPQVPLSLGHFDRELCLQAARIILSPGVSLREPVIAEAEHAGIPIVGDIELFALAANALVVGITGSNGKSTVTTLVGEMAKAAGVEVCVGGNLGEPALSLLQQPAPLAYVLELSSFQLETTASLRTLSAVVLNLCEDHMDRYDSLTDYLQAKQRIYMHCQHPVINRDDPVTWQGLSLRNPISFGLDAPSTARDFGVVMHHDVPHLAHGHVPLMPVSALKMKGAPYVANALAALALGSVMQLPVEPMLQMLRTFPGLPHRCQWVANMGGVDWYNDSKATNVGAALAAIGGLGQGIAGKVVVIAGGQGKGADFSPLMSVMQQYVKKLILIGEDADLMEAILADHVVIHRAKTLQDAVQVARDTAAQGDVVVLAPACASFDMFKNFEDRGAVFVDCVRALG